MPFLSLKGKGVYTPRAETTALASRMVAAGGAAVPRFALEAMDAFFATAIASTWWAKLDALYVLKAADFASASQNWKAATNTLTNVGGVRFLASNFMTGKNLAYLQTGFNPSTANGQYTQNSAHIGWWQLGSTAAKQCISCGQNTKAGVGASAVYRLNAASTPSTPAAAYGNCAGHIVISRNDANNATLYHEGSSCVTTASPSAALTSDTITLIGANSVGQYSDQSFSVFHFGAGLTAIETLNVRWTLKKLLVALGGESKLVQSLMNGTTFTSNAAAQAIQNANKVWSLQREAGNWRFEVRDGENCATIGDNGTRERAEIGFAASVRACGITVNQAAKTLILTGTPFVGALFLATHNNGSWTGQKAANNTSNGYTVADFVNAAGYKKYYVKAQAGDTLNSIATALAAKMAVDFAGTSSSGAVISVPAALNTGLGACTGGETIWLAFDLFIEPSPIGILNDALWGPVLGQIHNSNIAGDNASPPFSFNVLVGDKFQISAQTRSYFPRLYSGNERVLYESTLALPRGVWHKVVVKYVNGLGLDNTPAAGQTIAGIMGPNTTGANRFALGTGEGALSVWLNGTQIVNQSGIPIGYIDAATSLSDYAKFGVYRSSQHVSGDNFAVQYQNIEVSANDLSARIGTPLAIY
jgi:Polysaccharide lyase